MDPVSATFAGISAASSIFGGIMGSSAADKQNRKAREAQKAQEKYQLKILEKKLMRN